jgi:hypothetical protein
VLVLTAAPAAFAGTTFTVTITDNPGTETQSTDATFGFTASAPADFTCQLDGGDPAPCGTNSTEGTQTYSDLAEGSHSFVVTADEVSVEPGAPPTATDTFDWTVAAPTTVTTTETQTVTSTQTESTATAETETDTGTTEAAAAGDDDDNGDIVWIVLGGIALLLAATGAALGIRATLRGRRRAEWERQSDDEDPPEDCRVCTRHCRRTEIALKPGRRHVAALTLVAGRDEWQLSPALAHGLDQAAHGRRSDDLDLQLLPLADGLVRESIACLADRPGAAPAIVVARLAGGTVECAFTLSHCVRGPTGGVWQVEEEWTGELADERDVHALDLRQPQIDRLEPVVAQLRAFVGSVDVAAPRPPEPPPPTRT